MPKKPKPVKSVKPEPSIRGLRKAEAVSRQINRWIEKAPMESNAGEWLKFAVAVKAAMELLEADCYRLIMPYKFAKSRMEITKESRAAETAETDE